MNVLERIKEIANESEERLAREAPKIAELVNVGTNDYTQYGPEEDEEKPFPNTVTGKEIDDAIKDDKREKGPIIIEQEKTPYFKDPGERTEEEER